jgi:two-component system nitrogen regulation response regulator GlnG
LLARQPWRGNVRELRNFVYRLALLARDEVIDAATIEPLLALDSAPPPSFVEELADGGTTNFADALAHWIDEAQPAPGALYSAALAAFERPLFLHALSLTGGNQLRAARLLGINRNTLRKRLSDLAIDPDDLGSREG